MASEYDGLLQTMNALPGEIRKKSLSKSLRALGDVVKAGIVERAPEQTESPHGNLAPGQLKADIRTRVHIASDANAAGDADYVTIGPSGKTEYVARFVEDGHVTRPRTKPSKKPRKDRVDPHPFVRPAFDATRDEAIAVCEQTMADEIRKAFDAE